MDHWPDIDRCRKLEAAGFPQKTLFWWCTHGPRKYVLEYGENECNESTGGVAAPIVTELLVEIVKLLPTPALHERDPMVEMSMLSNGKCSAWGYLGSTCYADTLPNALSDLWMEMAGKEKEKEP